VLTSSDGANFEEAKCWQSSTRAEVAYEESFMFDTPRIVKAVTIIMRSVHPSVAAAVVLLALAARGPNRPMAGGWGICGGLGHLCVSWQGGLGHRCLCTAR
jgi:hypothetical protein